MNKKAFGLFLLGASFLFCSCVDDTYDLANKEIKTDIQLKGNKLALPLGSFSPIVLDSILVDSILDSIPFVKVNSETRAYSLSLNDSMETGVGKDQLEALKTVSALSADIEGIKQTIDEIGFPIEPFNFSDTLDFGDVELTDVTLPEKTQNITIDLDELTLEPININVSPEEPIKFNIPKFEIDPIKIGGVEPQKVNISIPDIPLGGEQTPDLSAEITMDVPEFEMPEVTPPTFSANYSLGLTDKNIDKAIQDLQSLGLNELNYNQVIKDVYFNETDDYDVNINFGYELPDEIEKIEDLTKIVFDKASSKVNFKFTNPTLLQNQNELERGINFKIQFPSNYKLAIDKAADESKYHYELENAYTLNAVIKPGNEPVTEINLYLTEIALGDFDPNQKVITINDKAKCTLNYMASGDITIAKGTRLDDIPEGLKYNLALDVAFEVGEVWGSTKPVSVDKFESQELDLSFAINDLDYIKSIDRIELDSMVSTLRFTMGIKNGFGEFDLASNSYIVLKFPKEFVFAENQMKLPKDLVSYDKANNQFKISSLKVFDPSYTWELPISGIHFGEQGTVTDGTFEFTPKAVIKAVTNGQEGVATIGGATDIDLVGQTEILFKDHIISLSAPAMPLAIVDVQGSTGAIEQGFASKPFDLKFPIEGELEDIKRIDFVQFDSSNPITIAISAEGFENITFAEGYGIALQFPEKFVFDYENCTLGYNESMKAFVIDKFEKLTQSPWKFPLQKVTIGAETDSEGKLPPIDETISMFAVQKTSNNNYTRTENIHVGLNNFSLKTMREDGLLGTNKELEVALQESKIGITDVQVASDNIDVPFGTLTEPVPINLPNLTYITRIGSIVLEQGYDCLNISPNLENISPNLIGEGLGRFDLAPNSYIELKFPDIFYFDTNSSVPNGVTFASDSCIRITSLSALHSQDWALRIEKIAINETVVDYTLNKEYTVQVAAYSATGEEGKLTIAAIDDLTLTEIQATGGEREMNISVNGALMIEDVDFSTEEINFPFEKQAIGFPIDIPNSDLIKRIEYISFENGKNTIPLNISMEGELKPFDLSDDSKLKITFPEMFVFGNNSKFDDFDDIEYNAEENAIYINSIEDIANCNIQLALDRINIYQDFDEDFELKDSIYITAIKGGQASDKLYIAGHKTLNFSEVSDVLGDKKITFSIPETTLSIEEAVIVSNGQTFTFEETESITLDETIGEAIKRVDFVGLADSTSLTLTINTEGLEDATVTLDAELTLPPVFNITSTEKGVSIEGGKIIINKKHKFNENNTLTITLWVHNLDFRSLEGGGLTLNETKEGYQLKYDSEVAMKCTVSVDDAEISSDILDSGIALDATFEMGRIVLKDFTGIYGGTFDAVNDTIDLGIGDVFSEMEEKGLTLANTKPELMISLYNSVGVPVDVDLSIVGKDGDGNVIPSSMINPGTLHIKPAKFENGVLETDTTRWLFTSNEAASVPGYETVVVENLDSLLNKLPNTIEFGLTPTIVTEGVVHRIDLSKPIELGGSYSISMPFDLQFAQSIPLPELDGDINAILSSGKNNLSLANPQLALTIYNPIAQELSFDLSLIGKNSEDAPIKSATIFENESFVLAAGTRNEADGTITPTPTRWLFAVSEDITKEGFDTKAIPALSTLLEELPHKIDIALNAHFNTDLTKQIDYNNDLDLKFEYDVIIPLQFNDLRFNYTDTISGLALGLEETLEETGISISNVGLAVAMNLKNTLPIGLTLHLTPLDAQNNVIEGMEISDIELPAGDGSAISNNEKEGKDVEVSIKCASTTALSALDKIAFSLDVASGNGDNALAGKQGIQIRDIVLQVMCDVEMGSSK